MTAKSITDLRGIIDDYSDLSDADTLSLYRKVRDQILAAAFTEHGTKVIVIRNRTHEVSDPAMFLSGIENLIRYYENRIKASSGPSTNFARLSRAR